ncbi:WXG100 family type VII secretion target [Dactylosporangium sp. CA-092794]|uniref:WXG100 family type VII secretion target n=1 Tax=Dactylosporangium sp. CA-092794 TaxID=3239929 RepID=UPI003D91F786
MAEVNVDYAQVNSVAARLTSEGSEIASELGTLQTNVTDLLTSQGGLWLQQSSPVMSSQYVEFNTSLSKAINELSTFAQSFNLIVKNLTDMDDQLSKPST